MKKTNLYSFVLLLPLLSILSSCGETSVYTNSDLLITELFWGDSASADAVEIYNKGNSSIDLSLYSIDVYSSTETTSSRISKLEGTLEAKGIYILASSTASEEIIALADQVSANFMTNGKWPVALKRQGVIIDLLGYIGYGSIDYGNETTLVRKVDMFESKNVYDPYDFIRYDMNNRNYLGNINNSVTPEELLAGPKLIESDFVTPFSTNGETGNGGARKVTLQSCIDGDTSKFKYPDELHDLGITDGTLVRYQNIDTPESYSGNIQPWGIPAKQYTCQMLNANKNELYLQSVKGGKLRETYSRILGYVWAGDSLLNYLVVLNGYSEVHFNEISTMYYKDVSYYSYMKNAEQYAIKNGLKIHGELDPTWDYEKNEPKS